MPLFHEKNHLDSIGQNGLIFQLPSEVIVQIINHLDYKTRLSLRQTCKFMAHVCLFSSAYYISNADMALSEKYLYLLRHYADQVAKKLGENCSSKLMLLDKENLLRPHQFRDVLNAACYLNPIFNDAHVLNQQLIFNLQNYLDGRGIDEATQYYYAKKMAQNLQIVRQDALKFVESIIKELKLDDGDIKADILMRALPIVASLVILENHRDEGELCSQVLLSGTVAPFFASTLELSGIKEKVLDAQSTHPYTVSTIKRELDVNIKSDNDICSPISIGRQFFCLGFLLAFVCLGAMGGLAIIAGMIACVFDSDCPYDLETQNEVSSQSQETTAPIDIKEMLQSFALIAAFLVAGGTLCALCSLPICCAVAYLKRDYYRKRSELEPLLEQGLFRRPQLADEAFRVNGLSESREERDALLDGQRLDYGTTPSLTG